MVGLGLGRVLVLVWRSWNLSFEESIRREGICGFFLSSGEVLALACNLHPVFLCIVDLLVLVVV